MRLDSFILEAIYKGNLGVVEFFEFMDKIKDKKAREEIIKVMEKGDFKQFKMLIKKHLGIELK